MNVLCFEGGLGNQMFQYAFCLSLKKRVRGIWVFDISQSRCHHNGFELDEIFGACKPISLHNRILHCLKRLGYAKTIIAEENGAYYKKITPINSIGKCIEYRGYWQSEKYFLDVEKSVRKAFRFDLSRLNEASKLVFKNITNNGKNYVSIHVRRGDYMDAPERQVCSLEYYKRAIAYINEHVNSPIFMVFSDDIQWCYEQFGTPNESLFYIDWNTSADSWQDMCLMSACGHHIIANSSFSWWGAWLDDNADKIVVCPQRWNVNYPEDTDKIPERWIRL